MGNLMTSFGTGVSGIHLAQTGLNTSSHNIANTDTAGYVRQQVIIADHQYVTRYEEHNGLAQTGLGTQCSVILQRRNQFLDVQFREESGRLNFYKVRSETVNEMEDLFGELTTESFADDLNAIWSTFQELSKTPDDITAREQLVAEAHSFLTKCKTLYNQIGEYKTNLNSQIGEIVDRVNEISKEIHLLNCDIVYYEASGQQANDLYDRRNLLLDELSTYVPVDTIEYSTGVVVVNVEGIPLVSADSYYTMKTEQIAEGSSILKPVWADNGGGDVFRGDLTFSPEGDTDIGKLKGILVTRGSFTGNYSHVPQMPNESDYLNEEGTLDSKAYRIAMNEYEAKVDWYNSMIKPAIVTTMESQFDTLAHGIVTMINDVLCPNEEITIINDSGEEETIRVLNEKNAPVGCDGTAGNELFSRANMERYTKQTVTLADGTTKEVYRYNEEDPSNIFSMYTLSQIEMNSTVMTNTSSLPLLENSNSGYEGGYASTYLQDLLGKWDDEVLVLDPNSRTFYSFNDFYNGMIGSLGTEGKVATNYIESENSLVQSIENQRQSLTGVSTDEELVDLIRFQHMYNACSRYITVVDEMLESLIISL